MAIDPADHSDSRLPEDLQFISEQLWEDAEHLVRTYPANAPQNWRRAFATAVVQRTDSSRSPVRKKVSRHVKVRPAAFGGVVAAAVMGVIAAGWYSIQLHQSEASGSPAAAKGDRPHGQPERVITAEAELFPGMGSQWWGTNTISRPTVLLPAGAETLDYFSGPEQEAVLDALRKGRIRERNVEY